MKLVHTPSLDIIKGIEGWKQMVTGYFKALSDINIVSEDTVAEGDTVVNRWTITAKHTGDLMGVPSANEQLKMRRIAFFHFVSGKVGEIWNYQDRLGLMQQLGVIQR